MFIHKTKHKAACTNQLNVHKVQKRGYCSVLEIKIVVDFGGIVIGMERKGRVAIIPLYSEV